MDKRDLYFLHTPVYRIWCDLIEVDAKVFSGDFIKAGFGFSHIICERESVTAQHLSENQIVQVIYRYSDRRIDLLKTESTTQQVLLHEMLDLDKAECGDEKFDKQSI